MNVVIAVLEIMGYLAIGLAIGVVARLDAVCSFAVMLLWPAVIFALVVVGLYELVYNGFCKVYKFLRDRLST